MRPGTVGVVVDPIEQLAVGNSGGGEEHIVGVDQISGGEDLIEIEIVLERVLSLALVPRPELALDLTAHAEQGRCGNHGFG